MLKKHLPIGRWGHTRNRRATGGHLEQRARDDILQIEPSVGDQPREVGKCCMGVSRAVVASGDRLLAEEVDRRQGNLDPGRGEPDDHGRASGALRLPSLPDRGRVAHDLEGVLYSSVRAGEDRLDDIPVGDVQSDAAAADHAYAPADPHAGTIHRPDPVTTPQPSRAARHSGTERGSGTAPAAGTTEYCAKHATMNPC